MTKRTTRRMRLPSGALKSSPWGAVPMAMRKSVTFSVRACGKALPLAMEKGPSFSRSARAALSSRTVTPGVPAAMTWSISSRASSLLFAASPHLMSLGLRRDESFIGWSLIIVQAPTPVYKNRPSLFEHAQKVTVCFCTALGRDVAGAEDAEGQGDEGDDVDRRD